MNFDMLTGYEFEEYIAQLFKSKGFDVQKTSYSHDGGIDLIATFNEPIFSGKYIIQCKKYTDTMVGQPTIRDLYGVVMSEHANKGILITTSDFTDEARTFADNKNIELINGTLLKQIASINSETSHHNELIEGFNYDRYKYLMDKVGETPTDPCAYNDAINFLKTYVMENAPFISQLKILDKILDLYHQSMQRCFKKKSDGIHRTLIWLKIAEIEMLKGNIGAAINILLDNDKFYIETWLPSPCGAVKTENTTHGILRTSLVRETIIRNVEARNLYSILKKLGFDNVCELILSKYSFSEELARKKTQPFGIFGEFNTYTQSDYDWILEILNSKEAEYSNFISRNGDSKYIFSESYVYDIKSKYSSPSICYPYESKNIIVDIEPFISRYPKSHDEIKSEITLALNQHGIAIFNIKNK